MFRGSKSSENSWEQLYQVRDTKNPRVSRDHHYLPTSPCYLHHCLPMISKWATLARIQRNFLWSITILMQCVSRWFHLYLIWFVSNDQQDTKEQLETLHNETRELRGIQSAKFHHNFATLWQDNTALHQYNAGLQWDNAVLQQDNAALRHSVWKLG